jgi:hypothetical protein
MDKTKTVLLGAVAGLTTIGAARTATAPDPNPSEFLQVSSYADLLAPVQNAATLLKADNTLRASDRVQQDDTQRVPEDVQLAEYYTYRPRYHHHHHQAYRRDHHHHHTSYVGVPGVGRVYVR